VLGSHSTHTERSPGKNELGVDYSRPTRQLPDRSKFSGKVMLRLYVNSALYITTGSTVRQTSMMQQHSVNKVLSKDMRMLNTCLEKYISRVSVPHKTPSRPLPSVRGILIFFENTISYFFSSIRAKSNLRFCDFEENKNTTNARECTEAAQWLIRAAAQFSAPAQFCLGYMYENCVGVMQQRGYTGIYYCFAAKK